ncbi:MAG: helix-turn-helix domain-containing protein [Opitutae bacterium]|nr:helix-turn-helix domain-containing protein [Opitutae bacterium]
MQTIGERLEEARKRKGISIREAAEATKIRGDYLQKFESNQFDMDLPEIYARGFLRSYAVFLKLPAERILADYKSLGMDEPRPRTPSREVYGRMDLSIASAGGNKDAGPATGSVADGAEGGDSRPRKFAKIGTSLPEGPYINPRLVMRIAMISGGALALALIIWGIAAMTRGGSAKTAAPTRTAAKTERMVTLVALDTVRVEVNQKSVDGTVGESIFQSTMMRGETHSVPWRGALRFTASVGANLNIEINGSRYPMPQGSNICDLPAPSSP